MVDAAVSCNLCGVPYTLPEGEVVGRLPHVLLCSHIFCAECLHSLESPQASASSVSSIICPECTMSTDIGEEGVNGLQVDSRIIGLIYTAKMNSKRSPRGVVKHKACRTKSSATSTPVETAEAGPDMKKVLDEALCKATENLKTLDTLHQTLVTGMQAQLKKEKTRIIKEIENCVDRAIAIIQKRRSELMSELSCLDQLFQVKQEVCQKLVVKRKELCTAIQKARHVRQVPLLETYCHLDEILETLQTGVDAELYDGSCLNFQSTLSCILSLDCLRESVQNCLKITDSRTTIGCEVVKVMPSDAEQLSKRPVRSGGSGEGRRDKGSHRVHAFPFISWPQLNSASSPNVIVEEIIEERESVAERDVIAPKPKPKEKPKVQRRNCKPLLDRASNPKRKSPFHAVLQWSGPPQDHHRAALHEWVVVTHVNNPTHFYVRYVTEQKAGVMLARKISHICSDACSYFTVDDQIKTGALVFARWKDVWCRAVVRELFQKGCLECVSQCFASDVACMQVFFQEYGSSKGFTISGDGLSGLNECVRKADATAQAELHRWAPQAIKCSLKDIIPSDLVKGWTKEASEEIRCIMGSNVVEMLVLGEEKDTLLVDLKKALMDNTINDTPLSLREHLVFMELARFYSPQVTPIGSKPLHFYPPVLPKLNTKLNAVVSHVNTPSDFYIQLVDNMEFLLLNTNLQNCYGPVDADSELQIYSPILSQACVALYDNKDWCRAQVTGFPGGRMVEVQFIDFGNKETLSVKDLRQIKDVYFALPAMAVWCSLVDFSSVGEMWSDESIHVFRELTEQKLVTVVAKKLVAHSKAMPVCLYAIGKKSTERLASIGEVLVTKGLASPSKHSDCPKTSPEEPSPDETAVWDPPLEETALCLNEPELTVDSSEQKPNLILPTCLKDVRVRITHVTSPGNICVQLLQFDSQLKRVHDLLKREYLKSEPQDIDWKVEMFCAANVNGVWERGKVCSVSSSNFAEVLRCDFGNRLKLHYSSLRLLPAELAGSLLLECCLSGIRPAGGCSTWTATACDFISFYLTGATAIMTIKEPTSVRPVPVFLFRSNRAGQDVSMADFLISEGLALRERSAKAAPVSSSASDASEELGLSSGETSALDETRHEKNDSPTPSCSCPPKPAPRITPPPERVKTQAYMPPEFPLCGHTCMSISAVSDDGIIYTMTPQAECEFERLQECLQQCIKTLPRQKHYNWRSVLGCAVMGSDMLWYRGQVLEVIGGHVKVLYVDQGTVENIPVCHVYPMVLCENVPQLCVPCQINGVVPVGGAWQRDAVALMRELLFGRLVNVQVMEVPDDPRALVTVELMLDGMPLSRIMVHNQHATFDPAVEIPEECVVKPPVPDLDDWDLNTEGLDEPQTMLPVFTDLKLPDIGKQFWVRITHIRTPNEVFLSLVEPAFCEQEALEETLGKVNQDIDSLPLLTDFPIGSCLAEYSDGKHYRAKLLGFSQINPSIQLLVRHVDFGSDDIVPPCKLRCLPQSLLRFPCAAVCVQLVGFRPPHQCQEEERIPYRPEWSMRAMTEMIDLLHGKLRAVVTTEEPRPTVLLYKADGTLVHMPLVKKGLADYE
ncbi:RING finger protein 17 isoform X2 [Trichomycterus rosablanca]|uniref:RING finger protein 17 isoform X2 n=1 Tax=Trichomycterus rosablanca TaxID=2290929 RepID=UPI002F3508E1